MRIVILDQHRRWLQTVPVGYLIHGEIITTPGGSSWCVPGAFTYETVTSEQAAALAASRADYEANIASREEVRVAKRTVALAAQGTSFSAADEAVIEAELGDPPTAPVLYIDQAGDVTTIKPKVDTRVETPR